MDMCIDVCIGMCMNLCMGICADVSCASGLLRTAPTFTAQRWTVCISILRSFLSSCGSETDFEVKEISRCEHVPLGRVRW